MYEVFEHTADLGLRVTAPSCEALFAEAGRGLFSLFVAEGSIVGNTEEREFELNETELPFLFFDWLSELLHLFETEDVLLSEFHVRLTPTGLTAVVRGEKVDRERHRLEHEVKAITYHQLKVEEHTDGGWAAEVIVDI